MSHSDVQKCMTSMLLIISVFYAQGLTKGLYIHCVRWLKMARNVFS